MTDALDRWKDARPILKVRAWAIDPFNVDVTRCEITDIISCSFTDGYYSDTRVSASLTVLDPKFPEYSWIRLGVEGSDGYSKEIGTFAIGSPIRTTVHKDHSVVEYTLVSAIWAISENRAGKHWSIAKKTKTSTAIQKISEAVGRPYVLLAGFNDYVSKDVADYEVDDSFSSILFDLCDRSNNRMTVDSHGRLAFGPYVEPKQRGIDWYVDERDPRSIVIAKSSVEEDTTAEAYDKSIVVWKGRVKESDKDDTEIIQSSSVASTHPASPSKRGFSRSSVHSESEMSPKTKARAKQLADQYLVKDSDNGRNCEITVMWFPVEAGQIMYRYREDGQARRWLVQTVDSDFKAWTSKLTLKEA